ncbi:Cyclin-D1-binding protein 1, partial [Lamprotornis superbus]
QTFQVTSQEATKLSLAFSRPPLPSAEDCRKLSEDVQNAVLAVATVYYWLPKGQGTTLRKMVRDATTEVVEGMIQLTDTILNAPVERFLSQEQLISTGGVWEACEQVSNLPRDNQAAVVSALAAYLVPLCSQALVEGQDPYGDIMEDEELGFRGNRDTYWSEADRQLLSSCMGLMKASKACLKKVLAAVKAHGKADSPEHIAQLDDLADIANEISPSVDELALSMYPPVNPLAVRLNAAKLASVLKKVLEIAKTSHVCPPSEEGWVQFLTGAVDHNMNKVKNFTQAFTANTLGADVVTSVFCATKSWLKGVICLVYPDMTLGIDGSKEVADIIINLWHPVPATRCTLVHLTLFVETPKADETKRTFVVQSMKVMAEHNSGQCPPHSVQESDRSRGLLTPSSFSAFLYTCLSFKDPALEDSMRIQRTGLYLARYHLRRMVTLPLQRRGMVEALMSTLTLLRSEERLLSTRTRVIIPVHTVCIHFCKHEWAIVVQINFSFFDGMPVAYHCTEHTAQVPGVVSVGHICDGILTARAVRVRTKPSEL